MTSKSAILLWLLIQIPLIGLAIVHWSMVMVPDASGTRRILTDNVGHIATVRILAIGAALLLLIVTCFLATKILQTRSSVDHNLVRLNIPPFIAFCFSLTVSIWVVLCGISVLVAE